MIKHLFSLFITVLPVSGFAQTFWDDSTSSKIINEECNGTVFTKCEQIPSLKIPIEAFQDSLKAYLKERKSLRRDFQIRFRGIVTKNSHVLNLYKESGEMPKEEVMKDALLHFSDVWVSGKQNSHNICAYARIIIEYKNENLSVVIKQ